MSNSLMELRIPPHVEGFQIPIAMGFKSHQTIPILVFRCNQTRELSGIGIQFPRNFKDSSEPNGPLMYFGEFVGTIFFFKISIISVLKNLLEMFLVYFLSCEHLEKFVRTSANSDKGMKACLV